MSAAESCSSLGIHLLASTMKSSSRPIWLPPTGRFWATSPPAQMFAAWPTRTSSTATASGFTGCYLCRKWSNGSRRSSLNAFEVRRLAQEISRVLENDFLDGGGDVATLLHLQCGLWHRQRIAHAPVAGAVHPDFFRAIGFQNINRAGRGAFGFRIQRHARPHPA